MIYEFDKDSRLYDYITRYKVKFDVELDDETAELKLFVIPDEYQGRNIATKIMELFCDWLDDNQYVCKLIASSNLGVKLDILLIFYESFGFEEIETLDGNNVLMERIPY